MNKIVLGDCVETLNDLDEKSIDLIYLDPPFFSNRQYEVIWKDRFETASFRDRWEGGIETYVSWLVERLRACHRVLKDTGVLVCHLDWHASHYIKMHLDGIFGYHNFINEVIWQRDKRTKLGGSRSYGVADDRLLIYSKTGEHRFSNITVPYTKEELAKKLRNEDPDGRKWSPAPITLSSSMGRRPNQEYTYKGYTPPYGWRMIRTSLEALDNDRRLHWSDKGIPSRKMYAEDLKGKPLNTVWTDLPRLVSSSKEAMGYPTQKPLALLERIIGTFTTKDSVVLDPFCGCGTTIHAAQKLGRSWIGMDISPVAVDLMRKRLVEHESLRLNIDFEIEGIPESEESLLSMNPTQFADWCCHRLGGMPNPKRVGDMGIDGWDREGNPIQSKQNRKAIGRNTVVNFETALRREKKTEGTIVAISFGRGAKAEVARAKREDGITIHLVSAFDLLNEQERDFQEFVAKHDYGLLRWTE